MAVATASLLQDGGAWHHHEHAHPAIVTSPLEHQRTTEKGARKPIPIVPVVRTVWGNAENSAKFSAKNSAEFSSTKFSAKFGVTSAFCSDFSSKLWRSAL